MQRRQFVLGAALAGALPFARVWSAESAHVGSELPARNLTGAEITLASNDITDLARSLQGELLLPTSPRYEQARRVWNGSIDKHPALIAACVGAGDVMRAVNFAREHKLLTAVRAGGHSTSGKSTCDGGIMIDLSPMRGVRVDPTTKTAYGDSDAYIAGMRAVWARLEPFTKGFYVNSRYEDDMKAFRENYGDNYPRLVALKKQYDPLNLFRLNANVVPS